MKKTTPSKTGKGTLIEESIEKLKETALELERFMRVLDGMERFGTSVLGYTSDHNQPAVKFFEGLSKMRQGVYEKMCRNMADCFMFSGVSDGIKDVAIEKLSKQFGGADNGTQYCVTQFLERWGNLPISWNGKKEEDFRGEVNAAIAKTKSKAARPSKKHSKEK